MGRRDGENERIINEKISRPEIISGICENRNVVI